MACKILFRNQFPVELFDAALGGNEEARSS